MSQEPTILRITFPQGIALELTFPTGLSAPLISVVRPAGQHSRMKVTDNELDALIWKLYQEGHKPAAIYDLVGGKVSRQTVYNRIAARKKALAVKERAIQSEEILEEKPVECHVIEAQPEVAEKLPEEAPKPQDRGKDKPEAKAYNPQVTNGRIFDWWMKERLEIPEITDILNAEGIMFSEEMVRSRLRKAGVDV